MIDLAQLRTAVQAAIQDGASKLASSDIDGCLTEAITGRYSRIRPRKLIANLAGDGVTFLFPLSPANFPGWVDEFSEATDIEYPVLQSGEQGTPTFLDADEFGVYLTATPDPGAIASGTITISGTPNPGDVLTVSIKVGATTYTPSYTAVLNDTVFEVTVGIIAAVNVSGANASVFALGGNGQAVIQAKAVGAAGNAIEISATPAGGIVATPTVLTNLTHGADPVYANLLLNDQVPSSGQTARVYYTAPHRHDGATVPKGDFFGVMNLAASLCAMRLQAIYNQAGNNAIGADAVNYQNKAGDYAKLATALDREFQRLFGMDKTTQAPATGKSTQWKNVEEIGWPRMTHGG